MSKREKKQICAYPSIAQLLQNHTIGPFKRSFRYQDNQVPLEHIKTTLSLIGLSHSPAHLEELLEVNHHTIWNGFQGGPNRLILPLLELWAYRLTKTYSHARDLARKLRLYCKLSHREDSSLSSLKREELKTTPYLTLESTLHLGGNSCTELEGWNHQDMAEAVFAECISSRTLKYPEYQIGDSKTYLKIQPSILEDPLLLSSLKRLHPNKTTPHGWEINPEPTPTTCYKLPGRDRHYFLKQLSLANVPHADYEINIAEKVHAKGIMTPTPYGVIVSSSTPYIIIEFQEGAINLLGLDWRYKKPHRLWRTLCRQEEEVYTALGDCVWRLLDNGVNPLDIAKRNFIATFDSYDNFECVMPVDFEKTVLTRSLRPIDRAIALEQLNQECTPSQKRYILRGYRQSLTKKRD